MALSDEQIEALEALAKKHGALSYRNRADTQNPAFGFSTAGLAALLAEVHKDDEALMRQLSDALEWLHLGIGPARDPMRAIAAARARLAPPAA